MREILLSNLRRLRYRGRLWRKHCRLRIGNKRALIKIDYLLTLKPLERRKKTQPNLFPFGTGVCVCLSVISTERLWQNFKVFKPIRNGQILWIDSASGWFELRGCVIGSPNCGFFHQHDWPDFRSVAYPFDLKCGPILEWYRYNLTRLMNPSADEFKWLACMYEGVQRLGWKGWRQAVSSPNFTTLL